MAGCVCFLGRCSDADMFGSFGGLRVVRHRWRWVFVCLFVCCNSTPSLTHSLQVSTVQVFGPDYKGGSHDAIAARMFYILLLEAWTT